MLTPAAQSTASAQTPAKFSPIAKAADILRTIIRTLAPIDRVRVEDARTDVAWEFILQRAAEYDGDESFIGRVGTSFRNWLMEVDQQVIEYLALHQDRQDLSLNAFKEMCDKLSDELGAILKKEIKSRYLHGSHAALVLGAFSYFPPDDGQPDMKLAEMLTEVADRLNLNPAINDTLALIPYGESETIKALIDDVGGGSDRWLDPDGRNYLDVRMRDYHPDDIYLLSGDVKAYYSNHRMSYAVTFRFFHPRTRNRVPTGTLKFERSYWYHPTRNWISEEEDSQLAPRV